MQSNFFLGRNIVETEKQSPWHYCGKPNPNFIFSKFIQNKHCKSAHPERLHPERLIQKATRIKYLADYIKLVPLIPFLSRTTINSNKSEIHHKITLGYDVELNC